MALTRIQSSGLEGNITLGNVVISGTITDGTGAVFVAGTGAVGFTGSAGVVGSAGTTGFTGSAGADGVIGYNGSIGFTGSTGADGYAGSQGSTGFVGSKGDTGLGFRIAKTYLSVAALTADVSPAGIVTGEFALIETGNVEDPENSRLYLWSGSSYSYVTDLSGAVGLTGPAGAAGFTGSAGTGFTGSAGTSGFTGSAGIDGFTGSIGFTGSASTEIGFTGSAGIQGNVGSIGFVGSRGDTGFVGSQGTPGEAAAIGYTGSQGFVGSRGEQGVAGVSTSSLVVDTFTGTGSTTAFNLSVQPTGINQTLVTVNGSVQAKNTYSLSGAVLTFDQAPANSAAVEVTIFVYGVSNFVGRNYTGDGSTTTFAVSSGITANSVIVSDNGVVQSPLIDYTIAGSTLTFAIAPATGSIIHIREIPAGTVGDVGFTGSAGAGFAGSTGAAGYTGSAGPAFDGNVTGNLTVSGTTFVTGDIIPTSNNTVNIGSPTARFGTVYISANTLDIGGSTLSTNESGDLTFSSDASGVIEFNSNVTSFLSNVAVVGQQGAIGYTGSVGTTGFTGSQGPAGVATVTAYVFDGGDPTTNYSGGPAFDCGGVN